MRGWMVVVGFLWAVSPARANDNRDRAEAKRHFNEGDKQYRLGHFDDAVKEYEASYALFASPALLWDLAQAHRKRNDLEKALHFYEQYASEAKPGTAVGRNLDEAKDQIQKLEPLVEAQHRNRASPPNGVMDPEPPPTPVSAQPAPRVEPIAAESVAPAAGAVSQRNSDQTHRNRAILGWAGVGVGSALLVTGVALLCDAVVVHGELQSHSQAWFDDHHSTVMNFQYAGWPLLAVGAAIDAGSIVILTRNARRKQQ